MMILESASAPLAHTRARMRTYEHAHAQSRADVTSEKARKGPGKHARMRAQAFTCMRGFERAHAHELVCPIESEETRRGS